MKANAALKMLDRVCEAASAVGAARATRANLYRIVAEERNKQAARERLKDAQDRPWATKDLTDPAGARERFEQLGRSGKDEVSPREVINCFSTLPYGPEVEPVAVVSLPFKDSVDDERVRYGQRRRIERWSRGEETLPGLRREDDGYYIDDPKLLFDFGAAFGSPTNETVKSRLGLASLFLEIGYKVLVLLPHSASGNVNTLPMAEEGARELGARGARVIGVNGITGENKQLFDWPRDMFTQFEGQIFADEDGAIILEQLSGQLSLGTKIFKSNIGEGGRAVLVGEHLVHGIGIGEYSTESLTAFARSLGASRLTVKDVYRQMQSEAARDAVAYDKLGFASAIGVNPFWGDDFTSARLERFGFDRRVFAKHGHVDMVFFPAPATRELGVHSRFYAQNQSFVEQVIAKSGYSLKLMPDRPAFACNAVPLPRGEFDLLMDRDSEPERALLDPGLRVITTEVPFADCQRHAGGVRCASNILWIPTSSV
ncbi:MAG: hypothetical protein NT099_06545 [Candidatus Saganbacteria bacterium]|nr:hypothetical protein [Candidatus Saganbacteria bacterium]